MQKIDQTMIHVKENFDLQCQNVAEKRETLFKAASNIREANAALHAACVARDKALAEFVYERDVLENVASGPLIDGKFAESIAQKHGIELGRGPSQLEAILRGEK